MSRVKTGTVRRAAHKKILKQASGYRGRRKSTIRVAKQAVEKAGQYAYRDRRTKKREFRKLWIARINAGARLHEMSYSRLINGLSKAAIDVDRKVLAHLAMHDEAAFGELVKAAKAALK